MIDDFHTIIYSDDRVATRAILHDVAQWSSIDAGDGWPMLYQARPELAYQVVD